MAQAQTTDPVADLLRSAPAPDAVRAAAWDAFEQTANEDDLATKLKPLALPTHVKAQLWDLKAAHPPAPIAPPAAPGVPLVSRTGPNRVGQAVTEAAQGVKAGFFSTVFHGGDLLRRGVGMDRIIDEPDVQATITPPNTVPGKVGFYGEQSAEFMVPMGQVARVTKGAPLLARMAAEGAGSAVVAGVQSGGNADQMGGAAVGGAAMPAAGALVRPVVRAAVRAAQGAADSGVGGAIAGAVRYVVPGEPRQLLVQALKPRSTRVNFDLALHRAIPEIKAAEEAIGRPVETIDDLLAATKAAKAAIQGQLNQMRGVQRAIGAEVDLTPVADAMVKSIPKKLQLEDPAAALRLTETADVYRRAFSLDEAETLLRETNAELDSFYAMYPQARHSARLSNAGTAALEAQATEMRTAIYTTLDRPGQGAAARELNRRYGSLMEVEGEAYRRANVAKRQQPESLSEQIGAVRAAGDYARGTWRLLHGDLTGAADIAAAHAGRAAGKAIKDSQTTDALIRRAFAGVKTVPEPIALPPSRPTRGLLPAHREPIITPPPASPPDPSGGGIVPAAPQGYEMVEGKRGAYRATPTSYSSDPDAAIAPQVDMTPLQRYALQWIRQDMDAIPFTKRSFTDAGPGQGGDLQVVAGSAGAAIYRAIVGEEGREVISASRADVIKAIDNLLAGKLTKTGELVLGVADDLAQGRPKVQRLMHTAPPAITPGGGE